MYGGCVRAILIVFMIMMVGCGINFKYFAASYIPAFILDKYYNEVELDRYVGDEDDDFKGIHPSPVNWTSTQWENTSELEMNVDIKFDYSRKPKTLWPRDHLCSNYTVRFGLDIEGAWLLSFPRSGNTWTRYLVEAASGIFTGSVYNSNYLIKLGYLGESEPVWWRSTIMAKTHSLQPLINHPNRPVVAIIRNPAKSILSYWNYHNVGDATKKLTGSVDKAYYKTTGFHVFVREKLQKWFATYTFTLRNSTRLYVVYYEKLRENPLKEIQGLLRFLRVKPDQNRLRCLSRHLEGNAKGAQRSDNPYYPRETRVLYKIVQKVDNLLKWRGFPALPDYSKYDT